MSVKVLIVDDHPFTRIGIRSILELNSTIDVVGEAVDGLDAVEQVSEKHPEIVIMDITMPQLSGIDATKGILVNHPDTKVIALSIHSGQKFVKEMLEAGAVGYLLKDEAPEELLKAVEKVKYGQYVLSSAVTRAAVQHASKREAHAKINVMMSKLHRPPIMPDNVLRTKVILELEKNIVKPLSIVSAGAGYGKSVAVSQWLDQTQYLKSWVSLDEDHNDIRTFLSYLSASIENELSGALSNTKRLTAVATLPPVDEISNILINDLCQIEESFILVLDDYHVIKNPMIHDLLDIWLLFPPPYVHLCIITRRDPPMKLESYRETGRLTEIRMQDLSLSHEEIEEFFEQKFNFKLSEEEIKLLNSKTEGWVMALRLVSMIMNDKRNLSETLDSVDGGIQNISEYLLREVLSDQPHNIQELLLKTSILDRFSPSLIRLFENREVTETFSKNKEDNLINWLKRFNLFIIPLDGEQSWFRYHHLFQSFLLNELKNRKNKNEINELQIKASQWFEEENLINEAIIHAMKGEDTNRAVRIIRENWEETSDADDFLIVDQWLSHLPEAVKDSEISLLFARFYSIFKGHRLAEHPKTLELIYHNESKLTKAEEGYLAFVHSMLNYFSGDAEKCLECSTRAIQLIPKKYCSFSGDAGTYWFVSMIMLGRYEEALASHRNTVAKFLRKDEPVQLGRARTNISFGALFDANLPFLRSATEEIGKTRDLSNFMLGFLWSNYVMIYWYSNDLEGVVRESEKVFSVKYEYLRRLSIDTYIMKALAYQELNESQKADAAIEDAINFAEITKDPSNLSVALSGRARLNLHQGNLKKANDWLMSTEPYDMNPTILWCTEEPLFTRCRVQLAKGSEADLRAALASLKKYGEFAKRYNYRIHLIQIKILQTLAFQLQNKSDIALNSLKEAICLAAPGEWVRPFVENIYELSELLLILRKQEVESAFINAIFTAHDKVVNKRKQNAADDDQLNKQDQRKSLAKLTDSEMKVLKLVAKGLRNQEIAEKLFNSELTIKKHIYHMFQKLSVKNRLSLVMKAKQEGILD